MKTSNIIKRRKVEIDSFITNLERENRLGISNIYPRKISTYRLSVFLGVHFSMESTFKLILGKYSEESFDNKLIRLIYSRIRSHKLKSYQFSNDKQEIASMIFEKLKHDLETNGINWNEMAKREKYFEVLKVVFMYDVLNYYGDDRDADYLIYIGAKLLLEFYIEEMDIDLK